MAERGSRIHDTLRAQVGRRAGRHKHPTAGSLDSQSVKTTQVPGIRGYDSGKHLNRRKRHILDDTLGLLLAVAITTASVSNPAGARLLFKRLDGAAKNCAEFGSMAPTVATCWSGSAIIVGSLYNQYCVQMTRKAL